MRESQRHAEHLVRPRHPVLAFRVPLRLLPPMPREPLPLVLVLPLLALVHRLAGRLHRRLRSVDLRCTKPLPELVLQARQRLHPVPRVAVPRLRLTLVHPEHMRSLASERPVDSAVELLAPHSAPQQLLRPFWWALVHLAVEQLAVEASLEPVHCVAPVVAALLRLLVVPLELLAWGPLEQFKHRLEERRLLFARLLPFGLVVKRGALGSPGPPARSELPNVQLPALMTLRLLLVALLLLQLPRRFSLSAAHPHQVVEQRMEKEAHSPPQVAHHFVLIFRQLLVGKPLVHLAGPLALRRFLRLLIAA